MGQITVVNGPVIAAGESLSNAVDCTAGRPVYVVTPTGWDTAPITFMVSADNDVFYDLCDHEGQTIQLNCDGLGRAVSLPPGSSSGIAFVKFRSGSLYHPVVQTAERRFSITLDSSVV